jgi:hypothetical protein
MGDTSSEVRQPTTNLLYLSLLTVHRRVGVDAMLHLLTETSVFASLPNQCLCQMTGEPLIHIASPNSGIMVQAPEPQAIHAQSILAKPAKKRKALGCHEDERPTKRLRAHESVVSVSTIGCAGTVAAHAAQPTNKYVCLSAFKCCFHSRCRVTPADIYLARVRLFYSRPVHVPHQNHIIVGLPPKRAYFLILLFPLPGCIFTHNQSLFRYSQSAQPVLSPQTKDTSRGFCRPGSENSSRACSTPVQVYFSPAVSSLKCVRYASSIQGSNERPGVYR